MGLYSARNIKRKARRNKLCKSKYRARLLGYKPADPLEGAPMARGIVLEKVGVEAKQPNSAIRKCVKVQLLKNNRVITAFAPGDGAIKLIEEHDEVTIEGMGGRKGRAPGDLSGVKHQVCKVVGISLKALATGKKEKPTR